MDSIKTQPNTLIKVRPPVERARPVEASRSAQPSAGLWTKESNRRLQEGWSQMQSGSNGTVVALIDDFRPGQDGFNHGATMRNLIQGGGAGTNGAVQSRGEAVQTIDFQVDGQGKERVKSIQGSLREVLHRVKQGEDIDAVSLSQQAFGVQGDGTGRLIQRIQNHGVPVVVAAGNRGPEAENVLARAALLKVENSADGSETRAQSSGVGNIRSEGPFTSQATANVAARAAQLSDQGLGLKQVRRQLQAEAALEGGSLDAGPNRPVFGQQGGLPQSFRSLYRPYPGLRSQEQPAPVLSANENGNGISSRD